MKKSKLMKKIQNFFLTNFFNVFCRKFGFNFEKLSNHYSQLKKHAKVDPETRSYRFLTETREKNPMSGKGIDLDAT